MDKRVQNPPAFTMDVMRDSKCDTVSTNEANLKARAKSQRFGFAKHRAQTGQQHGLGSSMGFGKSTSRVWHGPRSSERFSGGSRFSTFSKMAPSRAELEVSSQSSESRQETVKNGVKDKRASELGVVFEVADDPF